MGLITGGLTFRRYRVYQPLASDFRDTFLEGVTRHAHQENLKSRTKDPNIGWVNIFDAGDTYFDLNKILYDRYLVLGLRVDKKAVNGKLFNILLERQYQQVMEERKVERLAKNHKEEIKEALEEELLSQTLPSVNVFDLAWDIHSGQVFFFGTSDLVNEFVQGFFHDSFNHRLYPERTVDWLVSAGLSWEEIETRAQGYLPGGSASGGMAKEKNPDGWHENDPILGRELLLGTEFLTWLWQQSEQKDGRFQVGEAQATPAPSTPVERDSEDFDYDYEEEAEVERRKRLGLEGGSTLRRALDSGVEDITLWLDNKLIFKNLDEGQPGVTMLVGEAPSATPEAKLTLVQGKRPVEVRLGLQRGEQDWFFTLKALPGGLELAGLKIPFEVKEGEEEKIYERMYLLEVVTTALKGLFRQYFEARTSEGWGEKLEGWLKEE